MPFATNGGDACKVWFEDDGGDGPPLIVLGGFLDPIDLVRATSLGRVLGETGEFRLVFIDHRGHGRTDAPHDPAAYEMSLRVGDVVAVLDALELAEASVVGMSWGGRLCFGLGEHAPERLTSMVAIGQQPYAIDPDGPLARLVADAFDPPSDTIEPLVAAFESVVGRYPDPVRDRYLTADAAAMHAAWVAVMREGPVARDLTSWRTPCLICVAEDDADFSEQAERAAAEIPGARFLTIPGTDHLGADTAPFDAVMPTIRSFLRRPA